jgi:hypothetical protein
MAQVVWWATPLERFSDERVREANCQRCCEYLVIWHPADLRGIPCTTPPLQHRVSQQSPASCRIQVAIYHVALCSLPYRHISGSSHATWNLVDRVLPPSPSGRRVWNMPGTSSSYRNEGMLWMLQIQMAMVFPGEMMNRD